MNDLVAASPPSSATGSPAPGEGGDGPAGLRPWRKRRLLPSSPLYAIVRWGATGLFAALVVGLVVSIVSQSSQAFAHSGISFLWSGTWNPDAGDYAGGTLVVGTVLTTLVAMIIVVPVGLGISVSLSELTPRWLAGPLSASIEFLAAVPSIVVGLWALLVLSPCSPPTSSPRSRAFRSSVGSFTDPLTDRAYCLPR